MLNGLLYNSEQESMIQPENIVEFFRWTYCRVIFANTELEMLSKQLHLTADNHASLKIVIASIYFILHITNLYSSWINMITICLNIITSTYHLPLSTALCSKQYT